ncbi:uncharacterized protein N7511_006393 [Penicillium nucicola]|uniref:uncharacterized protein n=1 Tax=Penicillium nucicola TaxID=1850975 RepID=UPI0025454BCD|nr:uncharacterized protein N7511_006393 [Penicillium nucicola]KAJ5757699.1 hypothetical protein N7511_006393 [Penicillium nucicola]
MPSNAHEIVFRTSIAACNSNDHLRVYMQDVQGRIRETVYESGWSNGTEKNTIASAKTFSPLACTSKQLEKASQHIQVFYLSNENIINEIAYDRSGGWAEGEIDKKRFTAAPYSKLAAARLNKGSDVELRIYVQLPDNTIQEFGFEGWSEEASSVVECSLTSSVDASSGWQKMSNLGHAMPGTEIACTALRQHVRVYLQDVELGLVEKCFDANRGWYDGFTKFPRMQPRAAIACTSFASGSDVQGIHVFYTTATKVLEMVHDGKSWREGNFQADCIPGTEIACISWMSGSSSEIRVYLQAGREVSAISEFVKTHGAWKSGKTALPPA